MIYFLILKLFFHIVNIYIKWIMIHPRKSVFCCSLLAFRPANGGGSLASITSLPPHELLHVARSRILI